ncbi:MAG: helix-turn-helix transcriptional regulator, partial [Lachnospiraceae bacterium]|nr:helix-turn-helix transcriptional regulator [Lachnospiraceae bacterium]
MKCITIGMLIKETRKAHKNMTSQKLSRGICSVQMLYQIEKDQCDTDLLMTDMLLQRLGKSPDKLERILQNDMYHMVRVRELLKKAILKGKRALAEQILTRYPSRTNVDKMYQQRMKACLLYYIDKDHDAAFSCLQAAVHTTLPGFSYDAIDDYLISTVEMENLLALERISIERKTDVEKTTEKKHLRSCMGYIDRHFTDDEEHAKIYAKCAWLLARIEYHDGNYMQAIGLCESGLEGLRRNTMIYFALPLLKLMVQAGEQLGVAPDRSKWVQYYETLDFLWSSFAEPWGPADMIFHNCYQKEYHLDYELVRDERKAQGITQEEFADGIYQDTGSLSRFETGRISPNKKNFGKILEKLGIEKGRYSGYVVTDSFDTMELRSHLDQSLMRRRYDAAKECLQELKQCLDLDIEENRVLVTFEEILIAYLTGEVNAQEALENVKGLLKGFMDCDKMIFYHVPMRNEALIINNVCILLYETGQETLAMRLFQSILQRMDDSKVDVR